MQDSMHLAAKIVLRRRLHIACVLPTSCAVVESAACKNIHPEEK